MRFFLSELQRIGSQTTVNGDIKNFPETLVVEKQIFQNDKHADILAAFDENTLIVHGKFSKDLFIKLSEFISSKVKSGNNNLDTFLSERDIYFKEYQQSINLRKFIIQPGYLQFIDYTANYSNICVVYGTVAKVIKCTDGYIIKAIAKNGHKIIMTSDDSVILDGIAFYAFGRAEMLSEGFIKFHIHKDFIHLLPCKYGYDIKDRIIDSNYDINQQIDVMLGNKIVEVNLIEHDCNKINSHSNLKPIDHLKAFWKSLFTDKI